MTTTETFLGAIARTVETTPELLVPCTPEFDLSVPGMPLRTYAWDLQVGDKTVTIKLVVNNHGNACTRNGRLYVSIPLPFVQVWCGDEKIADESYRSGLATIHFDTRTQMEVEGLGRSLRAKTR